MPTMVRPLEEVAVKEATAVVVGHLVGTVVAEGHQAGTLVALDEALGADPEVDTVQEVLEDTAAVVAHPVDKEDIPAVVAHPEAAVDVAQEDTVAVPVQAATVVVPVKEVTAAVLVQEVPVHLDPVLAEAQEATALQQAQEVTVVELAQADTAAGPVKEDIQAVAVLVAPQVAGLEVKEVTAVELVKEDIPEEPPDPLDLEDPDLEVDVEEMPEGTQVVAVEVKGATPPEDPREDIQADLVGALVIRFDEAIMTSQLFTQSWFLS